MVHINSVENMWSLMALDELSNFFIIIFPQCLFRNGKSTLSFSVAKDAAKCYKQFN